MELTIDDITKLLGLPELTIRRWIRQGKIPVHESGGKYYFFRKEIEKWAHDHNIFLNSHIHADTAAQVKAETSLLGAMKRGGVFFHVKGNTIEEVLKESVTLTPLPENIDRDFLYDMLIQREKLASTGIGSGVSIPHPRYPLKELPKLPMITVCFLQKEIDFHAIDGIPVFVLFLMLSNNTKVHLKLLSHLSFCLRDSKFLSFLKHCKDKDTFLEEVKKMETLLNTMGSL